MTSAVRRLVSRRVAGPLVLLSTLSAVSLSAPVAAAAAPPAAQVDAEIAALDAATSGPLPFDKPSVTTLRSSSRKAFAHYVPTLPVSLDNQDPATDYYTRNLMNPNGESGKHRAYGGWMRDRPATRAPRPEGNWRLLDMESEVRSAISAGLDGFILVIYSLPENGPTRQWTNATLLMQAARNVDPGFKIILQPDMTGSLEGKSAGTMAKYMAQLASYSSAYRIDGRVVVSPFTTERKSVDYWRSFKSSMSNTYGKPVAFFPLFQNERVYRDRFDSISYGMANWGSRNPNHNNPTTTHADSPVGRANAVQALGQKWMQPVSAQDSRPRSGIYDEAQNTTNLRYTWDIAIRSGAEYVQYATWGDYPENSVMAPTTHHGRSLLDISAYYLTRWKTGRAPSIVRDTVYLTHRKHKVAARPTFPQTKFMSLRGGSSPARDTVEALTFLRAPATVHVTVGSKTYTCSADAGVDTCTVPLGSGKVSTRVVRSGSTVTSVASKWSVTSSPYVQDFQYVAVSSRREGSSSATSGLVADGERSSDPEPATDSQTEADTEPVAAPVADAPAGTVELTPLADSYANEAADDDNYGSSTSLSSRGDSGMVSYLRYDLPEAPEGKQLTKAVLRVRTTEFSGAGSKQSHRVQLAGDSWSESELTWDERPGVAGSTLGSFGASAGPGSSVTAVLDPAGLSSRLGQKTTLAVTNSGTDSMWFWSSEHGVAADRPVLELTFG